MLRRIWNYLFGKKRDSIDLDDVAKNFVEQVFSTKSNIEEDNLVEDLDAEHFKALDKEIDPLENATEIHDNSVTINKARISSGGEPARSLKLDTIATEISQDHIKKCDVHIHTIDQRFKVDKHSSRNSRRK